MKSGKINKRLAGFTLIEVMVALTIVAIALSALLSSSGTQANSVGYLKQKTLAHWVAVNELTQLRISKEFPDIGDKKDSTKMANHDWYWIRTTKKTEDDDALEVTFTIYSDFISFALARFLSTVTLIEGFGLSIILKISHAA